VQWSFKRNATICLAQTSIMVCTAGCDPQMSQAGSGVFQRKAFTLRLARTCRCCARWEGGCWPGGSTPSLGSLSLRQPEFSAQVFSPNAAGTSAWLVGEVQCTFSLKCYASSLSAAACFGNICLKADLRPQRGFEAITGGRAEIKVIKKNQTEASG